jgi:hypothetical protein
MDTDYYCLQECRCSVCGEKWLTYVKDGNYLDKELEAIMQKSNVSK